ncbi:Apd1p TDEL_0D05140 [Torulaspora delbrueckii]|uniref:Actin patches distal protein 1 n=1 Tax=Torulaspora delbrueckii TaxID=4950 RepID=G8ZU04_TORDE|nr:hypothetical protein TDEL_0D05140 [Torulaspora delbrueckii]CCE92098.1 hypothetical protein TDEL_0D05140 [Torulaspora delbrueckii]
MGLLGLFKGKKDSVNAEATKDIGEVVEICDESSCGGECNGDEDAELEKGERAFGKLKIDHETPLYGSSRAPRIHFVVPTSQTDWEHDACLEDKKTVQYGIYKWCENHSDEGKSLTCAVSSLAKDIMDIEVMRGTKNNVLVLPHFIWINDLKSDKVDETLSDLVPKLLDKKQDRSKLLNEYSNLSDAGEKAFVLLCSHATRDKRCGIVAPYLKKSFDLRLQKSNLYRDISDRTAGGVNVVFVNHVGGHKFAANVQVFLRDPNVLIWLGRVTPNNVPYIVNGMIIPHQPKLPWPEKVRCIQKYQSW